mgnify:FL=1
MKNRFLNDHCNYNCHLTLSPREAPTSPNLPWCLSSVIEHEFDFKGYISYHFEDPYLMTTNNQVEHTLKLVREIQSSTRVVLQLSKWFLHWMKFVVIITRLTKGMQLFLSSFVLQFVGKLLSRGGK